MNKKIIAIGILFLVLMSCFTATGFTIRKDNQISETEKFKKTNADDSFSSKIIIKGFSGKIEVYDEEKNKIEYTREINNEITTSNTQDFNLKAKGLIGWYVNTDFLGGTFIYLPYLIVGNSWVENDGGDYYTWDEDGFWVNATLYVTLSNNYSYRGMSCFAHVMPISGEEPAGWENGDGIYLKSGGWRDYKSISVTSVVDTTIPENNKQDNIAVAETTEGVIITGTVVIRDLHGNEKARENAVIETLRLSSDPTAQLFYYLDDFYIWARTNDSGGFIISAPAWDHPEEYAVRAYYPISEKWLINKVMKTEPICAGERTTLNFIFPKSKTVNNLLTRPYLRGLLPCTFLDKLVNTIVK